MSRTWEEFKPALSEENLKIVKGLGFGEATPVQAAAIPLLLSHKDVVVEAVTGSGKTLAFLLPLLQILSRSKEVARDTRRIGGIVMSPTRELAVQIFDTLVGLIEKGEGASSPVLKPLLLIGGVSTTLEEDFGRYCREGGNVIVATPGRLEEFLKRFYGELGAALKDSFEILILDEADRLLDLGFERSVRNILQQLPKQRRTGLFSATMTEAIGDLIRTGLRNPVRVTVKVDNNNNNNNNNNNINEDGVTTGDSRVPLTLSIHYRVVDSFEEKLKEFIDLIIGGGLLGKKVIVYFATCACVDYYARVCLSLFNDSLKNKVFALHGKMPHNKRTTVYRGFLDSPRDSIMFCTDLAARGLDFPDLDWVIQFDPPQDPKSFLHRCGRTARSGRSGDALVFLQKHEDAYIEMMANRGIPMRPFGAIVEEGTSSSTTSPSVASFPSTLPLLVKAALEAREVYEASIKAFVSYIRFYQEHQAKFIFRLKDLDIPSLARSFGLLRLPSMPELRAAFTPAQLEGFVSTPHDADSIAFTEKLRERQRQVALVKTRAARAEKALADPSVATDRKKRSLSNSVPWSEQKAKKQVRLDRREKKDRKREFLQKSNAVVKDQVGHPKSLQIPKKSVIASDNEDDDDDEMAADYKEFKREKFSKKSKKIDKL